MVDKPERLSLKTLMALMDILGCRMEELIEPVAATSDGRRRAVGGGAGEGGVGVFRPKRARITGESDR